MPTTIQVKVNTIQPTTRGEYNMIEITGLDFTNNKGFKKAFFENKKNGGRTVIAEISDTLKQDDWVEIVQDDSSYHNIQTMKKIGEPAGGSASPSQSEGRSTGGGGGGAPSTGGGKKSGNYRSVGALNREVALNCATKIMTKVVENGFSKATIDSLEKLAYRMEAFLVKGDFDAEVEAVPESAPPAMDPPPPPATQPDLPEDNNQTQADDDIPF